MVDSMQPEILMRRQAFYGQFSRETQIRKGETFEDNDSGWMAEEEIDGWDAFFFENTDYPLNAFANHEGVTLLRMAIGKEESQGISADRELIFGSVNFKNQVGRTDIKLVYEVGGQEESLFFTTEVLSYKMDYRTDMRNVIRDIEEEFAMLSYAFMKETYLTFRNSDHESTDLIWWQIFRDCFKHIVDASRLIIDNPKRRLRSTISYERADYMHYMPPELENEYAEFKDDPAHLYRMEEMYLSKDTIENRFLKYALNNIADRFKRVLGNVLKIVKADNMYMLDQINQMDEDLSSLTRDPFFRGIGHFKGFTQDSLVMKQAAGYRDVYEYWIILQCGYDLQEGVMQLEVKEISELYEMWCFIKVKNMVQHILHDESVIYAKGSKTSGDFVKTLVQGDRSEVTFVKSDNPNVELASLMYNATTDDEEKSTDESFTSKNTDIIGTTSKTTEQRPDIVLRLSKTENDIQYTYLFDAKYRLRDSTIPTIGGVEVPPVDAINQLHRYRDAIYYTHSNDEKLKREVIGGYVLYPGNLTKEQFEGSYYHRSVDEVNIGAFPLKPGGHWRGLYDKDGEFNDLLLDPSASEDALYHQIESWINDTHALQTLLQTSIAQKGLAYHEVGNGVGVAMIMMENYDTKKKFFENGKVAIPLKLTECGMTLLEHRADISFVLFHTRNKDNNKHLFRIHGTATVVPDAEIEPDYYRINKDYSKYLCVNILLDEELDSSDLNPSKEVIPYNGKEERYDPQYATLDELKGKTK